MAAPPVFDGKRLPEERKYGIKEVYERREMILLNPLEPRRLRPRELCALLYIPVYILWFYWMEHRPMESVWITDLPVDAAIPFCPPFVLAYVLWYPLILLPAFYLLVKDPPGFRQYAAYLIAGLTLSMAICTLVPSGQTLRPAALPQGGFCTWLIGQIYQADTNTNVFPSMHAVGGVAAISACFHIPSLKRCRIPVAVLGACVICSTVLIKQHAVIDVVAGVALCLPLELLVYRRSSRRIAAGMER